MANPTSNFLWQMPTPTDLVTDLPADFEVFGQAVDTSLADLKGGTSGQVLAKNSNTDMDFVWVAQDDSNAIQNAIVDAKGDLIGATAADTPARLAVGSNFAFLQAASGQSTGLLWNNAAWTSFTPSITAQSGSFTTVSAGATYSRIGKLCQVRFSITITTNGTAGTAVIINDLPFTSVSGADQVGGVFRENNITGTLGGCQVVQSATYALLRNYDNSYPGATGSLLYGGFTYEVA
jgi:hypothetical protein